jgi:hypothetical protein
MDLSAKRSKKEGKELSGASGTLADPCRDSSFVSSGLSKELKEALLLSLQCLTLAGAGGDIEPQNYTLRLDVGMVVENDFVPSSSSSSSSSSSYSPLFYRHLQELDVECTVVPEVSSLATGDLGKDRRGMTGMTGMVEFRTGVDEVYVNRHLRNVLTPKSGFRVRQEECLRVYTHNRQDKKRWCVEYPEAINSNSSGYKVISIYIFKRIYEHIAFLMI